MKHVYLPGTLIIHQDSITGQQSTRTSLLVVYFQNFQFKQNTGHTAYLWDSSRLSTAGSSTSRNPFVRFSDGRDDGARHVIVCPTTAGLRYAPSPSCLSLALHDLVSLFTGQLGQSCFGSLREAGVCSSCALASLGVDELGSKFNAAARL